MTDQGPKPTRRATLFLWMQRLVLVVSLFCFAWVLGPIYRSSRELVESIDGLRLAGAVALGMVGYAFVCVLLVAAWWWVSGIYGPRPGKLAGYAVWAQSQIAKYLPGNVGHLVSRQVLGRAAGLSHAALAASVFLEMGSLLLVAGALGSAGVLNWGAAGPLRDVLPWVFLVALACVLAWPVIDRAGRRFSPTAPLLEGLPHLDSTDVLRLLGPSVLFHTLFFLATGTLLVNLAAAAWGPPSAETWNLLWVLPIAWAAGAITLGAPAGVGVREAVLLLQLDGMLGPGRAAALAVAFRLMTTGGDLLTGLAGWWLRKGTGDSS